MRQSFSRRLVTLILPSVCVFLVASARGQESNSNAGDWQSRISEIHWQRSDRQAHTRYEKELNASQFNPDDWVRNISMHAERFDLSHGLGQMFFDLMFDEEELRFPIADRESRGRGEVYGVSLGRHLRGHLILRGDIIQVNRIEGLCVLVKLPVVTDTVAIEQVVIDLENQRVDVIATALWGVVRLVARANIHTRRMEYVDWSAPLLHTLPELLPDLQFTVVNPR